MPLSTHSNRIRTGLYYPRSLQLPPGKRLDVNTYTFALLFMLYGINAVPLVLILSLIPQNPHCENKGNGNDQESGSTTQGMEKCNDHFFPREIKLLVYVLVSIRILLVLLCGDIETNPGPSESSSISDSSEDIYENLRIQDLVTFSSINVQSVQPKIDILGAEFGDRDVILVTETWLKPNIPNSVLEIENFREPFRNDRAGDKVGGGVMIYVRDTIPCKRRRDLEMVTVECLWVEITVQKTKILFGLFYRPLDSSDHVWDHISQSVENAINTGIEKIVVLGDFNNNLLSPGTSKLKNIISQNGLYQVVSDHTFFCETNPSLLDPLIVNNKDFLMYHEVGENILEATVRYHCPIHGILNVKKPKNKIFKRRVWLFDRGNYEQYREDLGNVNWDQLINVPDINDAVSNVNREILKSAESNIPNKLIVVRPHDPPWITSLIKKKIRKRKRLRRKAKKSNTPEAWTNFRRARNECVNLIKNAKNNYREKQTAILNENVPVKNWWKTLRNLVGLPPKSTHYPPLLVNDNYIDEDFAKANAFNDYFSLQSSVDDSNSIVPDLPQDFNIDNINGIEISEEDVYDCLSQLDISKATGPDDISPRFLRYASRALTYPLTLLFNKSLNMCTFPKNWKIANVIPVFKNGEREVISNYRPISLLSIMGKVMERCVYKHLHNYFNRQNTITCLQSGFRPGDSTVNQLLSITDDIGKALDAGKEVRVVFCDISKAFDRVWHEGLLYKLKACGICGNLLNWLRSYLSNRKQKVVIGGVSSELSKIKAGVPQGSILGPLLFLIFINDIVNDILCKVRLFADDTTLYIIVENAYVAAEIINSDMDKIHQWSSQWLVNFNPRKTESMVITKKILKPHHPPVYMNDTIIHEVSSHKHLGLTFREDGSWVSHVDNIIEKVTPRLNVFRSLKFRLNRNQLQTVYFSFVRPILEYADTVWDNIPDYLKEKLEGINVEAARIVTGATKLCSKDKLYEDTGWQSLGDRRRIHKLIKFHDIVHGRTPDYLNTIIPPQLRQVHQYNTRGGDNIQAVRCRTSYYQNSFLPSTINEWNLIPNEVKSNPSSYLFKRYLNRDVKKPPDYYCFGNRHAQVLHARLRLDCSNLNEHLYRKNISDSDRCRCGLVESTRHYLLECELHNTIRARTIESLNDKSLKTLLYGNELFSTEENENIFNVVQTFVIESGRFGFR